MKAKPALSGVIKTSKGKGAEPEDDDDSDKDADNSDALDELAGVLGVSDDKREAFGSALKAFLATC